MNGVDHGAASELLALVRDLRTHLEWVAESCPAELIPVDDVWLEARREQYRAFALTDPGPQASTPELRAAFNAPLIAPAVKPVAVDPAVNSTTVPAQDSVEPAAPTLLAAVAIEALKPSYAPEPTRPPLVKLPPTQPTPDPSALSATPAGQSQRARAGSLTVLAEQVSGCQLCSLSATRTQTVFARGTGRSGIVFVGEGPGADEDAQGLPFVGKAGQLLDRMIDAMGIARDDVYICNVVKCRPPENRKPEESEMAACRPYLTEQLELLSPKVIVALGATAVHGLLGLSMGITRIRGQWRLYRGQIPVMPTFHPAYLLRQPTAKREVWQDLQAVLDHLGLKPPKRSDS
jgi:DNA polymerase